jgi:acetoin utilization deacetylase AcuC-like enzyme
LRFFRVLPSVLEPDLFWRLLMASPPLARATGARVAIVDLDNHRGNGPSQIFWPDPSVFFVSTHEAPLYSDTGAVAQRGEHGTIVKRSPSRKD